MSTDRANSPFHRVALLLLGAAAVGLVIAEFQTSWLQTKLFTEATKGVSFKLGQGKSPRIVFPEDGPYDTRFGYSRIPALIEALEAQGFHITHQAEVSPEFKRLTDLGIFPLFDEKDQSGLRVYDRNQNLMQDARYPGQIWTDFDAIPPIIVQTVLFVENRDLLDPEKPQQNPAVDWDRFTRAVAGLIIHKAGGSDARPAGGSTLATQIEKFRHSPDGRTDTADEKIQQMVTASLRTYMHGPDTLDWQERLVMAYVNNVPLAAISGFGEVFGLPDGLKAWYGTEFDYANEVLHEASAELPINNDRLREQGRIYRQIVALILAHRRPSELLTSATDALEDKTDAYLRILAREGVITAQLADAAMERTPLLTYHEPPKLDFSKHKLLSAMRAHVLDKTDVETLYELDRFDATVETTVDMDVQLAVENMLESLSDQSTIDRLKVDRFGSGNPADIVYSFTLYERDGAQNVLRVQADTLDQPLNINEDAKLDLGSTAKLRTLASYLDAVETLYGLYAPMSKEERKQVVVDPSDTLRAWAIGWLNRNPDPELRPMLEAAMDRKFSANPNEAFFTGGGIHRFQNFSERDDHKMPTLREAFRNSMNLPFIRVIREVVRYHMFEMPGSDREILLKADHPARKNYLIRFADYEGKVFLLQYWGKYQGLNQGTAFRKFTRSHRWTPRRFVAAYRTVFPDHDVWTVNAVAEEVVGKVPFGLMREIYDDVDPAKWPKWNDRAYLARVHPLELWLLARRGTHPDESLADITTASAELRQHIYQWLFRSSRKRAQDTRIRIMLEQDAFAHLHEQWQRLGYPFEELVASYATALGTSADRPDALAQLMGIVTSGGLKLPITQISAVHLAKGTPYETRLERDPAKPERVMTPETADTLRDALLGVVDEGTGRRLNRKPTRDWDIGGKTGTGDHQRYTFGPGGTKTSSVPISRSATFAFFIEDRYFGTMTAFVEGENAQNFTFTSALPVTLVGQMLPLLDPIVERQLEQQLQNPDVPQGPAQ